MYRFCSFIFGDPQKGTRPLRRLSIWIFSRHKKATFFISEKRGFDGHDSQEVPEEKTGTYWLDMGVRIGLCGNPQRRFNPRY